MKKRVFFRRDKLIEHTLLREHILQLEKRLMSYDYKELDELLAEDFLEFGSSGNSFDKKEQLEAAKSETTTNSIKFKVTDFNIKLLASDIVLATYRTFRHNDSKYALRSSIWKINEGKWKMIFHQGTPTT
ncbi:DUF4440 domain-containing protein [Metabacillus halosaccharovorans]|uniref:nuclear transport factor 2 family protein n=1 Tax=Metabacillus halosaccharovorans TaxID=930124 RepID=UPI001C1FD8C1|nr:DUF4440 domain-containing protein [Metabacillus halosaccharovorans]MBU7595685.1 DUF4440 domain-containing protein [Metabacillus halosaccharovorans]